MTTKEKKVEISKIKPGSNWKSLKTIIEKEKQLEPTQTKKKFFKKKRKFSEIAVEETNDSTKMTDYVAMDCEMVETVSGTSALAQVSIVNYDGNEIYNAYVRPKERIVDFRTEVSGITPALLKNAKSFEDVQKEVSKILDGRILIGHALFNDLQSLMLSHPRDKTRDTALYSYFKHNKKSNSRSQKSLKSLVKEYLHKNIQTGIHSPCEDARAALELYKLVRGQWERDILLKHKKKRRKTVEVDENK